MIFLDNNSTTPIDKIVKTKMMDALSNNYGNPHSNFHKYGVEAKQIIEKSRAITSQFFNVEDENIIFTSGATESNNLLIQGAAIKAKHDNNKRNKIFCSSIEHKCVLESVNFCSNIGFETHLIPVTSDGLIDIDWLSENIDNKTLLISVMAINNETGLRTNIEEIGALCKKYDVFFHSDLAQALHGEKFDINELNIDAVSISGHKIYGPKGIGCLIFNDNPLDFIKPIMYGGLQEQSVRSGTAPVFLIVGISSALEVLNNDFNKYKEHSINLKNKFLNEIKLLTNDIVPNFNQTNSHPGTLNMCLKSVDADMICMRLGDKVAVSSTAACNGMNFEYSYVLKNMGLSEKTAKSSIRLCFGRQNNETEALDAARHIVKEYNFIKDNV